VWNKLELDIFEIQKREEFSMIEVAHAFLEKKGAKIEFSDLVNEIQVYLGKTDIEIREQLSQFYTDLNVNGSFIYLGDNSWGLRSWYAIDEIDEELISVEEDDEEGVPRKKKKKRVNAFINEGDDDAIDWNNDDVEDENFGNDENDDELSIDGKEDDEKEEVVAYDSELKEVVVEIGEKEIIDSVIVDEALSEKDSSEEGLDAEEPAEE
jgi:DNA-directed RNA polymerase subunit delta